MTVIPGDRRAVRVKSHPKMPTYEPVGPKEPSYPVARGVLKHGSVEITVSCDRCRCVSKRARGSSFTNALKVLEVQGWKLEPRRCQDCATLDDLEELK